MISDDFGYVGLFLDDLFWAELALLNGKIPSQLERCTFHENKEINQKGKSVGWCQLYRGH